MANKMTGDQMRSLCQDARALGFRPERLVMLDERLTQWSKTEYTPSIAVKVLRHGKTAFEGAYGPLGPDKAQDSLTVDTIFPLCSITKPVVAALLSILQEEGFIDLNDPVRSYIPELTGDEKSSIRIWHLLTHTSGIIDEDLGKYFNTYVKDTLGLTLPKDEDPESAWEETFLKIREKMGLPVMEPSRAMRHETYKTLSLAAPPSFAPQKVMSYCNTGYQMALDIVTKVSGRKIDDFAGEKLFGPLQMPDTHFIFPREKLPRFVQRGKDYMGGDWLNDNVLDSESGSGGLKSNAPDMARFCQMFLNKGQLEGTRVLSAASVREALSDHNGRVGLSEYKGETYESTWGLGWNLKLGKKDDSGMLRCAASYEHGGFGGVSVLCDPETDTVVIYFTVCKTGEYVNKQRFTNMVIAAIEDD